MWKVEFVVFGIGRVMLRSEWWKMEMLLVIWLLMKVVVSVVDWCFVMVWEVFILLWEMMIVCLKVRFVLLRSGMSRVSFFENYVLFWLVRVIYCEVVGILVSRCLKF